MTKRVARNLTWEQALIVWWSFFWRSMLALVLFSFVAGFFITLLTVVAGDEAGDVTYVISVFLTVILSPVLGGIWAMKEVFSRGKYRDFTLAIVVNDEEQVTA